MVYKTNAYYYVVSLFQNVYNTVIHKERGGDVNCRAYGVEGWI